MRENTNIENLKFVLNTNGIYPSYHRLRILKYLMENRIHPSVEMIHKELAREIPTLSKTTIYNTLKLFVEKGLVIDLDIEGETRYDAFTQPHAHFKCVKCGRIYDIPLKSDLADIVEIQGHKPLTFQILIKGICKDCLKASE